MGDENKIKILGEENFRLLEVLKMTREGATQLDKRNRELKAIADAAVVQAKDAELKCTGYEQEIERLRKVREEGEKALSEVENLYGAAVREQKRLVEETARLGSELEIKAAREKKLQEKIDESKAELAQKGSELKAVQEALAQQGEAHRVAAAEYEERHRKADQAIKALQTQLEEEKETAQKLDAEKARLLEEIRTWEEQCAQKESETKAAQEALTHQEEMHRLTVEKHEAQHQKAAEVTHILENDKKSLLSELAVKKEEVSRLRISLQEAGESLEKLNFYRSQMEEKLLKADEDLKTLQTEKKGLEEEQLAAQKLDAKKTASLAALEGAKGRLESEKTRLESELETSWKETADLKDEIHLLNEISNRKQGEIEGLKEEKQSLIEDLESKAAEKVRFLEEIRTWERKCAERGSEIKANQEALAKEEAAHRLMAQEHEAQRQQARETARVLQEETRSVAAQLVEKTEEESRLRTALQQAEGQLEKSNARCRELEEKLQQENENTKVLQSEKKQLKEEQETARKLDAQKTASLTMLEGIKSRLKSEKAHLESELKTGSEELANLKDEFQTVVEEHEARHRKSEERSKAMQSEIKSLTGAVRRMEILLKEKEAALAALEKYLKEEKKLRVEAEAHSTEMEGILLALERKIEDIS